MPDTGTAKPASAQRRTDDPLGHPSKQDPVQDPTPQTPATWSHRQIAGLLLVAAIVVIGLVILVAAQVGWRPRFQPLRPDGPPQRTSTVWITDVGGAPGPPSPY